MRRPVPFFLAVVLGVAFDLLTKKIAFDALPFSTSPGYTVITGVLSFIHAENHGVAFSMLNQKYWPIIVITSAAIVFLAWLFFRTRSTAHSVAIVSMNLMLMGATGNLIDRVFLQYVRDFILFEPDLPLVGQWPVFNVADICITVGVLLYAVTVLFLEKDEKDKPAPAAMPTVQSESGEYR